MRPGPAEAVGPVGPGPDQKFSPDGSGRAG